MRNWILKFYGSDDFVKLIVKLLDTRKAAIARHKKNVKLQAELTQGQVELTGLKETYQETRNDLERAYRLELD